MCQPQTHKQRGWFGGAKGAQRGSKGAQRGSKRGQGVGDAVSARVQYIA